MSIEDAALVYVGMGILAVMGFQVQGWLWLWPLWVALGFLCSSFVAHLLARNPILGLGALVAYGFGLWGIFKNV